MATTPETFLKRRILLVSTVGGFTHAAPVLELGSVLAARGHEVHFGTNTSQEHWASAYPSISRIHSFGPALPDDEAEQHYTRMRQWRPSDGVGSIMQSKYLFDSYWPDTYFHLRELVLDPDTRPDMIVADFFVDAAAKDMMIELGVPIAIMWPQMPYLLAPVSYIPGQPGFQVDFTPTSERASIWSRIRNEMVLFWALPHIMAWTRWFKKLRKRQGVHHALPVAAKPNHLVFINSFFGLEPPKDLPPLMVPVGPILSDEFAGLDDMYLDFLKSHDKTVYIALGTHIVLPDVDLAKLIRGLVMSLDMGHINGVIWSMPAAAKRRADTTASFERKGGSNLTVGDILNGSHSEFLVTSFAPQRAILEHTSTRVYLTHGGGSSANEALFHGTPVLVMGYFFDQLANSARLVEAGVGLAMDKFDFTPEGMAGRIWTIVVDPEGKIGRNVERMKRIARVASRRKHFAADMVEEVIHDHELRFRRGQELRPMHLQTADMRMPIWKARNWDLWATSLLNVMLGRPGLDIKTAATVFGLLALVYYGIEFLKAVWVGLTGPLSKVPGPWLNRFTAVPWKLTVITGKSGQMCIDYPKKYGEIVRIAPNVVMISNKEAVHQIVVEKDLRKSAAYEKFRQDKDIATIFTIRDRAEYRTRRRLLSHGFSVSYIKGLEPMMLSCIRDLEEVIDERCAAAAGGKAEIDIWHLFGCLTSDVMSETSFGGSFKLVKNGEHPIRLRMSQNFRRNAVSQDPELKRLVDEVIARRRTSQDKIAKPDILQLLLDTHDQNPEDFSDKVVMAEMFLFMLAGGETAATTLIFAFIFLLDDPVRYKRLVDEIRHVFPDASSPVTNETTANLPFLNAVLKETLRLRAPAASGKVLVW
ncbi:UDP-glucuronosyltransferase 1-6 [Colletotrichum sp. SAR 10_66]|nr:UDP-glucuronosyltransferase 1-6 [Colletotrichum sp. SAR 10_66]